MAELKYTPVRHNHDQFLAKAARERKGFNEGIRSIELEYQPSTNCSKPRPQVASHKTPWLNAWAQPKVQYPDWKRQANMPLLSPL